MVLSKYTLHGVRPMYVEPFCFGGGVSSGSFRVLRIATNRAASAAVMVFPMILSFQPALSGHFNPSISTCLRLHAPASLFAESMNSLVMVTNSWFPPPFRSTGFTAAHCAASRFLFSRPEALPELVDLLRFRVDLYPHWKFEQILQLSSCDFVKPTDPLACSSFAGHRLKMVLYRPIRLFWTAFMSFQFFLSVQPSLLALLSNSAGQPVAGNGRANERRKSLDRTRLVATP